MHFKLCGIPTAHSPQIQTYPDLFVKTATMLSYNDAGHLKLYARQKYDFRTYLGTLSVSKWQQYAGLESAYLHLDIPGQYTVRIYSLNYDAEFGIAQPALVCTTDAHDATDIDLSSYLDAEVLGFELMPEADTELRDAYYFTETAQDKVGDVELSIAITTCRKEEYVTRNIKLIDALMKSEEYAASHLQVHVVDNGSTLHDLPVDNASIFLHNNPNTGGAGGFARGMMESLDTKAGCKATHVLVMDDDVEVLPEAFVRTFNLLALAKPEYADAVIAGAMLSIPVRNEQYEDVGFIRSDGFFGPVKQPLDLEVLDRVVENETINFNRPRQYSAFWYCCVPASAIERYGLPLPFFIRCDDAEFGLRDPKRIFMTMNGICVWHTSFGPSKFRASMECFYVVRNALILAATSPSFAGENYVDMYTQLADDMIEREWRKLSYDNVELCLDGLEAYLDGPAHLVARDAEQQFIDYGKRNSAPIDLNLKDTDINYNPETIREEPQRGFAIRAFTKLTKNGHRFVPRKLIRGIGVAPDEFLWAPNSKVFLKEKVYYVDSDGIHGRIHERDWDRFDKLWKRYKAVTKRYKNEHAAVEAAWREAHPYLTSPAFWTDYLASQQEYQEQKA